MPHTSLRRHSEQIVGLLLVASAPVRFACADERKPDSGFRSPISTAVRLAWSDDGRDFKDGGDVFLDHAAAPDLAILPNGQLLALFDYVGNGDSGKPSIPAVSRSRDGGRSWCRAMPIRFKGGSAQRLQARHGDLVHAGGDLLRLYFNSSQERRKGTRSNSVTVIRSAVTRNGIDYWLDNRARIRPVPGADTHPMVVWTGKHLHLYTMAGTDRSDEADGKASQVRHMLSRDGRSFETLPSLRLPEVVFRGSILQDEDGFRAYVSSDQGIRLLLSGDGQDWQLDPEGVLADAWDPAVIRLPNGLYLMLYCVAMEKPSPAEAQLVEVWHDLSDDEVGTGAEENTAVEPGAEPSHDEWQETTLQAASEINTPGESAGSPPSDTDDDLAQAHTGLENWDPVATDGFVPRPNFREKIDYLAWYFQYAIGVPEDNAYYAYAAFMPMAPSEDGTKPGWPKLNDMFNGDYEGPPKPWNPMEHTEWDASNLAAQEVLEKFREATMHEGYARPPNLTGDGYLPAPGTEGLLLGMLLPALRPHRQMVKATLADAWRLEEGKVSPKRKLEAWKTGMRAASHVSQGGTLIEELVGMADAALIQESARWALKHGVFTGDEIEAALDTLKEYDWEDRDPAEVLRGEHAMCMDLTQYLFTPPEPNGTPQLYRPERLTEALDLSPDTIDSLRQMDAESVHTTLGAIDGFYRELTDQMRVGYPSVRAADVTSTMDRYVGASPMTDLILPNLTRYYQLKVRSKASRRATQLVYATHLFKERQGRWPESLDELPAEHGDWMKTDPFTGGHFGYRLTDEGPRIYSTSENGVDDGGVHAPRWDDEVENDIGTDDFVFWPPQPRR